MDQAKDQQTVVLLSIHPEYAEAILDGTKQVEFRKSPFPRDLTHVVIYATAPVQKVVGWFQVDSTEEASPARLWRKYRAVGGIERSRFATYYAGRDRAVALLVSGAERFAEGIPLSVLADDLVPPQNYRYLNSAVLRVLGRSA